MQTKPPAKTFHDVGGASLSITERYIEAYARRGKLRIVPGAGGLRAKSFVGELYQPFFAGARFLGPILSETPMFVAF
jgi:hypothetical protein